MVKAGIGFGLMFLLLFAGCTPKGFKLDGQKLQQVEVTDMAELYSTYIFTKEDRNQLTAAVPNTNIVTQIIDYSQEKNWPDGVNTLTKRLAARATLLRYHFYKVAVVGNKTVLAIPPEKNRHMPDGFVPPGMMYMIFKSTAVIGLTTKKK